jgi:hypothetical protein
MCICDAHYSQPHDCEAMLVKKRRDVVFFIRCLLLNICSGFYTVYNCPDMENIGSIKFISGSTASPDMNFIDPIFFRIGTIVHCVTNSMPTPHVHCLANHHFHWMVHRVTRMWPVIGYPRILHSVKGRKWDIWFQTHSFGLHFLRYVR